MCCVIFNQGLEADISGLTEPPLRCGVCVCVCVCVLKKQEVGQRHEQKSKGRQQ